MRILVTGGSGFIGCHLVDRLVEHGHAVTNIDIKSPVNSCHEELWRNVDILDLEGLRAAVANAEPDILIHLAARAEISSSSWEDFASIHRGTSNLLDVLEENDGVNRLLNISTQLVVGPGHFPETDEDYKPYTTYGEAKAQAERQICSRDPGLTWCNIRPTNIWGPYHPSFADSIWRYLEKRYYLHPNTRHPVIRCYGYVTNAVGQIIALMNAHHDEVHGKVFYLADDAINSSLWLDEFSLQFNGKPTRRLPYFVLKGFALVGDCLKKLNLPAPIESGRLMRMTTNYPVPLENTLAISGKPEISLEEGVGETIKWMKGRAR